MTAMEVWKPQRRNYLFKWLYGDFRVHIPLITKVIKVNKGLWLFPPVDRELLVTVRQSSDFIISERLCFWNKKGWFGHQSVECSPYKWITGQCIARCLTLIFPGLVSLARDPATNNLKIPINTVFVSVIFWLMHCKTKN